MAGNVVDVTDDSFQSEVLDSKQPVLVDFWGPHCPPCRQIAPMIDQLATENAGVAKVVKVNVNEFMVRAQEYGVQAIPTLIVFSNGHPVTRFQGAQPKAKLQEALDAAR